LTIACRRRCRHGWLAVILRLTHPLAVGAVIILPVIVPAAIAATPVLPRLAVLLRIGAGIQNAEIMLGVLIVRLGGNAIAARNRIPCHRQVALVDLMGVAANAAVGTTAIEVVRP
jgi:hypothetical protein